MLEEEIELNTAIEQFCKKTNVSEDELAKFLRHWAAHPDYYVEFTGKVIKNLSKLNIKLFNEFTEIRRYHLL